jgi:hypothetical protein
VYDAGWRIVAILLDGHCPAGIRNVPWDGTSDSGVLASADITCSVTKGERKLSGSFGSREVMNCNPSWDELTLI